MANMMRAGLLHAFGKPLYNRLVLEVKKEIPVWTTRRKK